MTGQVEQDLKTEQESQNMTASTGQTENDRQKRIKTDKYCQVRPLMLYYQSTNDENTLNFRVLV
jgi:hypothetical protein